MVYPLLVKVKVLEMFEIIGMKVYFLNSEVVLCTCRKYFLVHIVILKPCYRETSQGDKG